MADENETHETVMPAGVADPAAIAVALAHSGTLDPRAAAFLEKQSHLSDKHIALADLQIEELKSENKLRHWSLLIHHIGDVMKVAFQFAVAFIVLAVALFIGGAVWSAAHDDGLVIEAFSVPPDMAARGLTGQVVASQLLDKLAAMQNATDSARPAHSYASNWGNDIKVEIPDTGVSVGEFYRYLASWLGHETHITGEIYRNARGIAVTARAGDDGATVSGSESDLDKLLQQAAEKIYRRTQPYRYAVYLETSEHPNSRQIEQARELLIDLSSEGPPLERAWASIGLGGGLDQRSGDLQDSLVELRKAQALAPNLALIYQDMDFGDANLGHNEASLSDARKAVELLQKNTDSDMGARARTISLPAERASVAFSLNDFAAALDFEEETAWLPDYSGIVEGAREAIFVDQILLHNSSAAWQSWRDLPLSDDPGVRAARAVAEFEAFYWMNNWSAVIDKQAEVENDVDKVSTLPGVAPVFVTNTLTVQVWPYLATALAMTHRFREAHALIDKTPMDCYDCIRNRALIDAAKGNRRGAEFWFARTVAQGPSIPMGYYQWGAMLLQEGKYDDAIVKFTIANQKGPHFADPLEMWGEALMQQNRSDLALAKFEEANKYAPNWGRLHLKWGEALLYAGRRDEATKQFSLAASLYLSVADKVALMKLSTHQN